MDDKTLLIEQYKLLINQSDKLTERRIKINQFYLSIISGIIVIAGFLIDHDQINHNNLFQLTISFASLGLICSLIWALNLISIRAIIGSKYQVILQIEEQFPIQAYKKEWEIFNYKNPLGRHLKLTKIEIIVPFIVAILFLLFIVVKGFILVS